VTLHSPSGRPGVASCTIAETQKIGGKMSYLESVLSTIRKESSPPKTLRAEHLFKLNEAVFNLSEEETVDEQLAKRLFQALERIQTAYGSGKYDNTDSNFFYDYLALLGTMQNQHFFSQKQTEKILQWIKEVVDASDMIAAPAASTKASKGLEAENEKLRKKLAKYEAAPAAKTPETKSKSKGKKDKEKVEEPAKGKGKAAKVEEKKGKGKGKSQYDDDEDDEEPPKGKGKGKAAKGKGKPEPEEPKSKGKSKGSKSSDYDDYDEPPSKGKGKGKGKGKSSPAEEEPPPLRASKGKGKSKDDEPKGKGKSKAEEPAKAKAKGKEGKKSKGKGKADDSDDEPPSKGKGKGKSSSTTKKGWKAK